MYHAFNFEDVLASSVKAAWQVEDVLPPGAKLDFTRRFLPEALARTDSIAFLSDGEKRVRIVFINQIVDESRNVLRLPGLQRTLRPKNFGFAEAQ